MKMKTQTMQATLLTLLLTLLHLTSASACAYAPNLSSPQPQIQPWPATPLHHLSPLSRNANFNALQQ